MAERKIIYLRRSGFPTDLPQGFPIRVEQILAVNSFEDDLSGIGCWPYVAIAAKAAVYWRERACRRR
jgi:hypothetical protein